MNKKILTGALAALTLGGALAATSVPAAAQPRHEWRGDRGWRGDWHDGWRRDRGWRGNDATAALLGLSLGAALAGGSYGTAYYPPAYYAAPRCRIEMRWNPYWGGYDRVRVCY